MFCQITCGIGQGAVCKCIFKVVCHGLVEEVARDVAVFHPQVLTSVPLECRGAHSLECEIRVEAVEALDYCVGHRHYARIAHHAVRLASVEMPYGKFSLLLIYGDHGLDEIRISVLLEYAVERHGCPVGVPEGECGVGCVAGVFMVLSVCPAVSAVYVTEGGRSDHRVVEGCVEYPGGRLVLGLDADLR